MWKAELTCDEQVEASAEAITPEDAVRQLVVQLTNEVSPDAELYSTISDLMTDIETATVDNHDAFEIQGGDFSDGFYKIRVYEA